MGVARSTVLVLIQQSFKNDFNILRRSVERSPIGRFETLLLRINYTLTANYELILSQTNHNQTSIASHLFQMSIGTSGKHF